jgi:8-oxo-dGTP diphosphatase
MVVVAAVIQRNSEILIGQRRRDDRHPMKWEFPGGKVEAGESPRQALRRELKEELNIEATIGREITRYGYRYTGRPVFQLIFFRVERFSGEPENLAFESIVWAPIEKLPTFDFLDGDVAFVKSLARGDFP